MDNLADRIAKLSPEQLAQLTQRLKKRQAPSTIPLQSRETNKFPLSLAQQRLWLLHQFQPDSAFYNIPALMRISGPLQVSLLEQSLTTLWDRHEPLRTVFDLDENGEPIQIIQPAAPYQIKLVDLQSLAPEAQQQEVERYGNAIAKEPFDLTQAPLLRTRLLKLGPNSHVLCLCMHHIIADGWALGIFMQELTALYDAFQANRPSPLPPLKVQYVDYGVWQRNAVQSDQRHLQYWQQQLQGVPTVLELPTDYPRPPVQSMNGARHAVRIDKELTQALREFGQTEGATLFMTLLAAFKVLLYRYTQQTDLLVGTPVANRNQVATERLLGVLVNTLALRTQVDSNGSFRTLLQQVRDVVIEANSHQDLPFEQLVEVLQPERSRSHAPLLQVMLTMQGLPLNSHHCGGLTLQPEPIFTGTTQFDLILDLVESTDGLQGWLEYNTDIFAADTIERIAQHLMVVLRQMISQSEQVISRVSLLTPLEQKQLLSWNQTAEEYPSNRCIHELFEHQVTQTPDALAVVLGTESLSYVELNQRANQLARYLRTLGVGPDTLVGLCVERSLDMAVGLLGVLKAGGAYVPLDPSYPQERLQYMVEDASLSLVLTQLGCLGNLPPVDAALCLDRDWPTISQQAEENLDVDTSSDHLAYVIYTSGSTGQSKGVMISHGNLVNHSVDMVVRYALSSRDRVLQFASLSFDVAAEEIFPTWFSGATLVLRSNEQSLEIRDFIEFAEQSYLTVLNLPAAYWHQWVLSLSELKEHHPSSLRLMVVGSEAVQPQALSQWRASVGESVQWLNAYGPTEATITATVYEVGTPNEQVLGGSSVPIGRPISNVETYILDHHQQLVPVGVPGELYIAGAGLARGYLNRPELTSERFIENPFSGGRLYKSGDLARYLSDGTIEYLGRLDDQVKVRGFRIELGEIEAVLREQPHVQQCVVIAHENASGNKQLVAYVVGDADIQLTELNTALKAQLPEHMVPTYMVSLESVPFTPNGKVDRRALPEPSFTVNTEFVAPQTKRQILIAKVIADVLSLPPEQIGLEHSFFDLGGHSLLAMQLVTRLRQTFETDISLQALFEDPTVTGIDAALTRAATNSLSIPKIVPFDRDLSPLPLAYAQERLWFLDQLEDTSATYNIPGAVRIEGALDCHALQRAIDAMVERHEILRTTFPMVDGIASQHVHPVLSVSLQRIKATDILLSAWLEQEANHPFDLAAGPLVRISLLPLSAQEYALAVTMHHIISDGWSINLFIQELAALYGAYAQGQLSPLPPLPIQYADYTMWQRQWLQGEVLTSQLDYWQQQLSGIPALLELPTDKPRPAVQSFRGSTYTMELPARLSQQVQALCQQQQITLFMVLLAAYQLLLYRYSRQADIVVGSPIANRQQLELESLIGCFVNTLVLRTKIDEQGSVEQLLQQVKQMTVDAYGHQDVPFEQVVDALQPQRTLAHSPLFQVMFVLQNVPSTPWQLPDVTLKPIETEIGTAQFDLTLEMQEDETGLVSSWCYNSDLFKRETIERMAVHFETLLAAMVADVSQPVATLPMLTQAEQEQLLVIWNDTAVDYPIDQCIHRLFEQQVQQRPDEIAILHNSQSLSYQELNARANQLAHHLQTLGVGPDVLVGLCVERSLEMAVGMLAILKAGGAYVPLDPGYPEARLQFILEDTGIATVLTQQSVTAVLSDSVAQVVCIDRDWSVIAQVPCENLATAVGAENLAYVIYTSGSTGQPKGVMVPHRGLVNHGLEVVRQYGLTCSDRILQFATFGFDVAAEEIFPCWLSGATLVLRPPELSLQPADFIQFVADTQLTVVNLPVSYWYQWVLALPQLLNHWPNALRLVVVGSEAVLPEYLSIWQQQVGHLVDWRNAYGPTEATITATIFEPGEDVISLATVPIGRPIANVQTYILDSFLQPVPTGVTGELHIGGVGLAKGYVNRPQLTAEKFITNPWGEGRLYKTGDLARYLSDGTIEFIGRIDHQVKLRGFRIELGEIEALLSAHKHIQQCAVVVREDTPNRKQLVAYVVGSEHLNVDGLKSELQEQLPDYMLPHTIVPLRSLPMMPNGKVDRNALPVPDGELLQTDDFVAPQTEAEETLAAVWQEILGLETIGIHDNFFELGGDSILSIQMIAQARKAGLSLSAKQLFQHQTIAELVKALANEAPSQILAQQGLVTGEVPLTPIQQWFLDQNWSNPHHYNQALLLQVPSDIQLEGLHQSLGYLAKHHDALRLRFERRQGQWHQYHGDDETVPLERENLSHLSAAEQLESLAAIANQQQASLDLSKGPLWRVVLFNLGDQQPQRLLVIIHHLIVDGVSWRILLGDLFDVYHQFLAGQELELPPKTTAWQDWSLQLQTYGQSPELQEQLSHWLELPWSRVTALPVDVATAAPYSPTAETATISLSLNALETEQLLKQVPKAYNTQINDVLLTALADVLVPWVGSDSILIDVEGHGREPLFDNVDVSRTMGWFTSLYPVLLTLNYDASFGTKLSEIKEQLRAIPKGGIGYGTLRYLSQQDQTQLCNLPQAELSFNYLGQVEQGVEFAADWSLASEDTLGMLVSPEGNRAYLLDINAQISADCLHITWFYSPSHHSAATIKRLANAYVTALKGLIEHCLSTDAGGYTPSDFPLVDFSQTDLDDVLQQLDL